MCNVNSKSIYQGVNRYDGGPTAGEGLINMRITIKMADWSRPSDGTHLEEAAELVLESFREFYDLVSPSQDAIRENLIQQLQDRNSELGYSIIIMLGESLGGISVYYPSDEIKGRQLNSLRHLMNVSTPRPNMVELLRTFRMKVEPIPTPRYMNWTRLGVTSEFRRLGVAGMLNSAMEYDSRSRQFDYIGSHLNRENTASMKMHIGRGFARISEEYYQFIAMTKRLS